ncbi:hypothetical protein HanOQP8_Chr05g0179201 [Helianthus annuus]|nr:hypothetical protein HanIR_Chr05g0221591 [Helianthus annuus]KAJ0746555.1 hypothetical protein HanOQP8_Chr05g0179201 [Helianthus annuus]
MIAKDLGFKYSDGEFMRLMCAMYLDVLIYYHKFKIIQTKSQEKEVTEVRDKQMNVEDPRCSRSEADKETKHVAGLTEKNKEQNDDAGNGTEHYALFADNDWQGIKRLHTRRRFNFNRAKAAVDDANISFLMHSRKCNYV